MEVTAIYMRELTGALRRIVAKGLAGPSSVRFSLRVPSSLMMAAGIMESSGAPAGMALIPIAETGVDHAWALDGAVYRLRPDVGAVVASRLPWASRLGMLPGEMPAVFDEQARQLGARVPRITLEGRELSAASAAVLRRGGNAFLFGQEAVCLGFNRDRAVFNAELLEKCAKAYVLASLSGHAVNRIPLYVRYIAGRRLRADERHAAAAFARGEVPAGFSTY